MADVYENALRTLQRLQGEGDMDEDAGGEGNALATTVGKAERAGREICVSMRRTSSTNSRTRSRIGSGVSLFVAEGGRCRSSFCRESATVLA